jgi:hypothetical protein
MGGCRGQPQHLFLRLTLVDASASVVKSVTFDCPGSMTFGVLTRRKGSLTRRTSGSNDFPTLCDFSEI